MPLRDMVEWREDSKGVEAGHGYAGPIQSAGGGVDIKSRSEFEFLPECTCSTIDALKYKL